MSALFIHRGINLDIRSIRKRDELLGKSFVSNNYGDGVVIGYEDSLNVLFQFYDPVCVVKCNLAQLTKGGFKNPMLPSVHGVGYFGVGKYSGGDKKLYKLWVGMLERTYCEKFKAGRPTYKDVTVCKEWHNFQNFAEWCSKQEHFQLKDDKGRCYQLDKDILVKGNKIYSPDTCCFVPKDINLLLLRNNANRGELPIGVTYKKHIDRFVSQITCYGERKHIGTFKTPEEAFLSYKETKEVYVKTVAEKYKSLISEDVYKALLAYEVNAND